MSVPETIPVLLRDTATRFGAAEAIVDAERVSFAELAERAIAAAKGCIAAGLRPGDRAAIWAPNLLEWAVTALGIVSAGGVVVPVNTRFKGSEARYILEKAGCRLLFTVRGFLGLDYPGMLGQACGTSPLTALESIIVLREIGEVAGGGELPWAVAEWDAFLGAGAEVDELRVDGAIAALGPGSLSDVIFTSGTTGNPKGVMASHSQTLRVFSTWAETVGLRSGDRYLVVNPFFHTFGYKAGLIAALITGAAVVPMATLDPVALMKTVEEERITVLPGPPTLYTTILDHPERSKYDLTSLRLAVTGAANVPVELIRRMSSELAFETVLTAYGLTEATGTVTMCRQGDSAETIANTSGRAIPGTEVQVVDGTGSVLAPGQPGEVVVRGYNVMAGYLDDPDQTAEAIDLEGWLHTGDIGVMDAEGNLKITDRKKDMFIVGGFNAYPAEIENVLCGHPAVSQAAVIGVPDDRMGEVGMAFVVCRSGTTVSPDELISWSRERIANYKVPRSVKVVDALPVNASGKVVKGELRKLVG